MNEGQDSLAEWFSSCFVSNEDFTLNEEETLCSEGATCFTYRVRKDGRLYLLKRLKPEFASDPRFIVALQKEYHVGSTLSHPVLVKYIEAGHSSLLMEYVNGKTLTQLLKDEPDYFCQKENAERFLTQLLEGVGHMHEHHVLHLDLKPDNIMITHLGHDVRIIDLGFCYTDCYDNTRGYTRAFAAPEQIKGGELTERTDLYAIGRILEWVNRKSGRKVFPTSLIRRCTAEKTVDRFGSIGVLLGAYRNASHHRYRNIVIGAVVSVCIAVTAGCLLLNVNAGHNVVTKMQQAHPGAIAPEGAADGVYVMDWEGRLVKPERWDTAYQALAVALLTPEFQARIALTDCEEEVVWGPEGLNLNVIASTGERNDDGSEGLEDYTGEYNTYQFMTRQSVVDTTALYLSYHYRFADGSAGYLPALGELYKVSHEYHQQINEALRRCGGMPLKGWHWTSTQKMTPNRAWALNFDDGRVFAELRSGVSPGADIYGAFRCKVRPFGTIEKRLENVYPHYYDSVSVNNAIQFQKLEQMNKGM